MTIPTASSDVRTTTATDALLLPAALAAVTAAAATSSVAAIAHAAGVSLAVGGAPIPIAGFATLTLMFSVLGIGIAAVLRRFAGQPRLAFVRTTIVLTALSLLPDLLASASVDTRITLMATHLVAAAIVIPAVAKRLP